MSEKKMTTSERIDKLERQVSYMANEIGKRLVCLEIGANDGDLRISGPCSAGYYNVDRFYTHDPACHGYWRHIGITTFTRWGAKRAIKKKCGTEGLARLKESK